MTTQAFIIPARADPDAIEAARPTGIAPGDRCRSELLASPWAVGTDAANAMPDPLPEPDPERRLRLIVGELVGPALYDFQHGYTSYASANDFCAAVVEDVRKYAVEMELDIEAAVAEARRLLEMLL